MQILTTVDIQRKAAESVIVEEQSELTCLLWSILAMGMVVIVIKTARS